MVDIMYWNYDMFSVLISILGLISLITLFNLFIIFLFLKVSHLFKENDNGI